MTEFMRPTVTTEEINETVARFVVEPLEPFEYGRGREMHTCGELLGRQAGVLLQDAQDLQIGLVESVHGIKFFPEPFFGGRSAVIFCVRM